MWYTYSVHYTELVTYPIIDKFFLKKNDGSIMEGLYYHKKLCWSYKTTNDERIEQGYCFLYIWDNSCDNHISALPVHNS